jgi:predicted transcriptional regulator
LFSKKRKPEAASERDSAAGSAKVPESSRETERDRDFDGVCATFGPGPEDLDEPEAKSAKETPEEFGERFKETLERRREAGLAPEEFFERLEEPFSVTLMEMIAKKGMTPVEVYTKANIDRKHFSKIRTIEGYVPSKRTILSLAVAMKLRLDETETFLKRAGYALSRSQKMDLVVEYFIIHHKYDVFAINEALYHYDLPLLGAN